MVYTVNRFFTANKKQLIDYQLIEKNVAIKSVNHVLSRLHPKLIC